MDTEEYVKRLEETITKFMTPLKDIPFPIAIKALSGCKVIPFNKDDEKDRKFLESLVKAVEIAGKKAFEGGIFTARPNEAGNRIEPFVSEALTEVGLRVGKPVTKSGKKRAAGYPDLQVEDTYGRIIYMDCKTYSAKTKGQSFRTFYFSPSKDPKINIDAHHLLISFELETDLRKGKRAFIPISWQIYTLDNLLVQVKHEFNASNKDLYREESLLAKGYIGK